MLVGTPATHNPETGNWVQGTSTKTLISDCRYEPNGSGNLMRLTDGSEYVFDGIVFLRKGNRLREGTEIEITDSEDNVLAKGPIKRFSHGQLNMRIWL